MATAIMKQKGIPEMDDVEEIISKISEESPYKRRPESGNPDDPSRSFHRFPGTAPDLSHRSSDGPGGTAGCQSAPFHHG